ncbi:hypothetical protein [Gracilinema caldarium]|uniref:hypothetical protein n=1 Tax=Gracilinema caldarium TaxID=215591 RepID=UPI000319ADE9|nr:hypothetical protein [Gracilinema caldarium]
MVAQIQDLESLLSWCKALIGLRKKEPALQTGSIELLSSCIDDEVLAYRRYEGEKES